MSAHHRESSVGLARQWAWVVIMVVVVVIAGRVASWWTEARRPPLKVLPGIVRWGPFADVNTLALVGRLVWAGGKDGVFVVDRDSGQVSWPFGSNGPLTFVEAIVPDKSGCLWIGHSRGLSRYDGTNLTTWDSRDGLPDNRVFAVMFDSSGRLWVGTQKGAAVREGTSWRVVDHRDGLSVDMVRTMLQDSSGGYWFGSSAAPKGGLTLLKQETPVVFNVANGLPPQQCRGIVRGPPGRYLGWHRIRGSRRRGTFGALFWCLAH